MVPPDEIPLRLERLIVNELLVDLMGIYREGYASVGVEAMHDVVSVVYVASFKGHGITLAQICKRSGVPRATAKRHLDVFIKRGAVDREGKKYWIADEILLKPRADIKRAMLKIHRACEALKILRNGEFSGKI